MAVAKKSEKWTELVKELRKLDGNKLCADCGERVSCFVRLSLCLLLSHAAPRRH